MPSTARNEASQEQVDSSVASDMHYHDLLEQMDNERFSKSNQTRLLGDKLETLRALRREIQQDEWKYQKPMDGSRHKMFLDSSR